MTIPLLALLQSTGATRLNILVKFDKLPSAESQGFQIPAALLTLLK